MGKRSVIGLIVLIVCAAVFYRDGYTIIDFRPSETRIDSTPIDSSLDPIQENLPTEMNASFIKEVDGIKALLTPKAQYKISGRVVSLRHYYRDWYSKLSPVDLAMAWGELSTNKYDDDLQFYHSDRYYNYRYKGSFPGDPKMIATHTANEHLIPANKTIFKTLKSIKEGETVELSGQLVDVEWMDKTAEGNKMDTSLTRDDVGAGACEIIYVTKVKIKNKVYE